MSRRPTVVESVLAGAAVLAFAAAAVPATASGLPRLLESVPDDTFYYLRIARHLADSGRSTFDGIAATNGYHPLWMALLVPIAAIVHEPIALLRTAIVAALALHACAALLVRALVTRLSNEAWGITAGACWLVNPLAFALATQATEAAVYASALLVAAGLHVRVASARAERRPASPWTLVVYGLALGVVCLARTDGVVIVCLAVLWLVAASLRDRQGLAHAIRSGALAAGAIAVVLAPWWLFSLHQVGAVTQDSGAMKLLWASERYPTLLSRFSNLERTADYFVRTCLSLMTAWNFRWPLLAIVGGAAAVAPILVVWRRPDSSGACAIRASVAALALIVLAYGTSLVDRQLWWLALPCLAFFVVAFAAVPAALDLRPWTASRAHWARMALLVAALVVFGRWHVKGFRPYPWQPDVLASQRLVERLVPPGERIGCFNAGIPGYFGDGRVVALDGLVSHPARRAWTERRVDALLADQRVRFIADEERAMEKAQRFSSVPLAIEPIASFPLRGWPSGRRVLWRVTPGAGHEAPR